MLEAAIEGPPYTWQIYLFLRILCLIVRCLEAEAEGGYREIDMTPKLDPQSCRDWKSAMTARRHLVPAADRETN